VAEPPTTVAGEVNLPAAYVTFVHAGQSLGTWLVTPLFEQFPQFFPDARQTVQINGRPCRIELRFRREYRPYAISLLDFTHEKYAGTEIPKSFSSKVRLVDAEQNENREVLIYMNHPFRYGGETFYQSGFQGENTTVLQVVNNPAAWIPYLSCVLVGGGMLVHFLIVLVGFLRKQIAPRSAVAQVKANPATAREPLLQGAAR
jgi:hypothetical protein